VELPTLWHIRLVSGMEGPHPHHEPEGVAVVVEVAVACQKFDAHWARVSSHFSEDRNDIAVVRFDTMT
jgi:hypothetical protein